MKLAIAWLTVLVIVVIGSCSINHRSGDLACTKQSDCVSPRVCDNGFCVVPDNVPIDGPPMAHDGQTLADARKLDASVNPVCPSQCTTCDLNQGTCKIECNGATGNCSGPVTCPDGFNCTIACNAANACRNGVTCTNDSACTIVCGGQNSCRNITCGNGPCDVQCTGFSSCRGISCGGSCACDVTCGSQALCDLVTCSSIACNNPTGGGCSSAPPTCHTSCP